MKMLLPDDCTGQNPLKVLTGNTDIFWNPKESMQRRMKFKHNERGQVIEVLTTAVLGLVFISKTTYEYDEQGQRIAETVWKDAKTVSSVKRLLPEPELVG